MKIRIGTRKSKLALWQANFVADKLHAAGMETELVLQETKGDQILDVSIAKIGSKGVFTEELEAHLASGKIDIAVHSAKDLQSMLPEGFEVLAFAEREKFTDVLVSDREIAIDQPLTIGTSSTRRVALLKHHFPHLKTVDVRGNLQTRIQKMRDGLCDALLLAYAGVHRMGYDELIRHEFDTSQFIPPVGQGSVAVEAHESIDAEKKAAIREALNDEITEFALLAERAYLAKLEGGCSIPVFALGTVHQNIIKLTGGIVSLDGKEKITKTVQGTVPVMLGEKLADEVLMAGGDKILESIKKNL